MLSEKKCSKCDEIKPLSLFSIRKDRPCGRLSRCKECSLKDGAEYRKNNRDKFKKYYADNIDRLRLSNRISGKKYYAKNKEKCVESSKRYNDAHAEERRLYRISRAEGERESKKEAQKVYYAKNKEKINQKAKELREKNKIKINAGKAVLAAIAKGEMFRPNECSECNYDGKIYGHHDDYSYELSVRWLCGSCHKHWHAKNGEGLNG